MSHVRVKVSSHFVADLPESSVVQVSRIRTEPCNYEFRLELKRCSLESVIVNEVSFLVDLVLLAFEEYRGGRNLSLFSEESVS